MAGPSGQVEWVEDHRCSWCPSQCCRAEGPRVLAAGGLGSSGEGLETLVSETQSPVSIKWGGGINRGEDREAL